jgi:hypothetical protein
MADKAFVAGSFVVESVAAAMTEYYQHRLGEPCWRRTLTYCHYCDIDGATGDTSLHAGGR